MTELLSALVEYAPSIISGGAGLLAGAAGLYTAAHFGAFRPKDAPPLVPGKIPFIGCWYQMWADPVKFLEECREKYGECFAIKMGGAEMVFCFDERMLNGYFKATEEKLSLLKGILSRGIMIPLVGETLPKSPQAIHQALKARKDTIALFRKKFMPKQKYLVAEFRRVFDDYLKETGCGDSGVWDSRTLISTLSVRMAINAVCGPDLQADPDFCKVTALLPFLFDEAESTLATGWIGLHNKYKPYHRTVRTKLAPIIKQRLQWQRDNPEGWVEEHNLHDLLAVYLDSLGVSNTKAEEEEAVKLGIFVCSNSLFGTLANLPSTIEGTLGYILNDEKLHNAVIDDIRNGYQKFPVNKFAKTKFPFLEACFNEYIRLWPVLFNSRYVSEPFKLPGGYVAPAGSVVNVCPRLMMRATKYFPDPHTYNPYRIYDPATGSESPGIKAARKNLVYMPFGRGTHMCAGMELAFSELKAILGLILREFELEMLDEFPGTKYIVTNTAQLAKPVRIKYTRRAVPLGEEA